MLADETDRSIGSVSLIIARVAAGLEAAGVDTPSSLDQAARAVEFRAFLSDRVAEDAFLDTIYVVSATEPAFAGKRLAERSWPSTPGIKCGRCRRPGRTGFTCLRRFAAASRAPGN